MATFDSDAVPLALILGEVFLFMDSNQQPSFFTFDGDVGGTAGYAGVSAASDASKTAIAAGRYLNDSRLLNQLTEHVYKLLLEDLRSQRERLGNYNSQRWL
ncbi:hypothetical protein [Nostoc edaphicum]|nr:hypothetical protein [Nostoc edaphicum]